MLEIQESRALAIIESSDPFPVNFDEAWQWIGYSRKDHAKRALLKNFELGIDFLLPISGKQKNNGSGGHNIEEIRLTTDCFKAFCMMAGTSKGKEVRNYFLECEKAAKKQLASLTPEELLLRNAQILYEHRKRLDAVENNVKAILQTKENAEKSLQRLEPSAVLPLQATDRARIERRAKAFMKATNAEPRATWTSLHTSYCDRYRINLLQRAKNASKKSKKATGLDIAEELGVLPQLYAVACEIWQLPN